MEASIKWRCSAECPDALILAGDLLFAGGQGRVVAVDTAAGKIVWTCKVSGTAKGLAAAAGRLFVSTDTGAIYCFGPQDSQQVGPVRQTVEPEPYPADQLTPVFEAAAEYIVQTTGINRGYCLVLGCQTGRLAMELAKRTELQIYGVEPDAEKVRRARKALDAAGLYGERILIDQSDLSRIPYSDYFANLIVSEAALLGQLPSDAEEAFRMLKPLGGTICIGQPAEAHGKLKPLRAAALRQWLREAVVEGGQVTEDNGLWLTFTRGPLAGAGSWTHQYAEPGNTTCSDDQLVKCPLGLLWFGQPGPGPMAERHRRATAPLAVGGRFFVQGEGYASKIGVGENLIMAYDAYNGLKLWQRSVPARTIRTGVSSHVGNLAANSDSLLVVTGDKCLRLDAATGQTKFTYKVPPSPDGKPHRWGYVACAGGLLYGTGVAQKCDYIFALDLASGQTRWIHAADNILEFTISIGDGRLFFATSAVTEQQRKEALKDQIAQIESLRGAERIEAERKLKEAPVRLVVALDAATGKRLWQRPMDLTGCCGGHTWGALESIYHDGVLLLFGVYSDGHFWQEFFAGKYGSRRIVALSAGDGSTLWSKLIGYRVRPLVVGNTLHAEPWAFDLHTGEQKMRIHPVTGRKEIWQFARPGHHCGCPAASPHTMLFRSGCLGYYDLVGDYGTMHFGSMRPGCWINFIPANGLLLVPEASSGCMCAFPNTCTIVFKHRDQNRAWAYFSQPGPMTPVEHLAINLGAPGDRKDKAGTLWFGYPRPGGSLVLRFNVGISFFAGGGYFDHDPALLQIRGTDKPWLFRCGARGLKQCVIPLGQAADKPARYTVRLAFAELDQDAPSPRAFDIKLQGQVVAEQFDVVEQAGGRHKALIREFRGVEAGDKLTIELVPSTNKPTNGQLPILQGVEIVKEER